MKENKSISNEIVSISNALSTLSFKEQFEINQIAIELSSLFADINFEILENVRRAFDDCNDSIKEIVNTIDSIDKINEQRAFMAGQISMMSKLTNNIFKTIINNNEWRMDKYNPFINSVIKTIGDSSVVTHKDLADKLHIQPASLTMKMKRNISWKKYVSSYVNPNKQNSVLYILNGSGKSMYEHILVESENGFNIRNLIKLDYSNFQGGQDYEREKERIIIRNCESELFRQQF